MRKTSDARRRRGCRHDGAGPGAGRHQQTTRALFREQPSETVGQPLPRQSAGPPQLRLQQSLAGAAQRRMRATAVPIEAFSACWDLLGCSDTGGVVTRP